MIKISIHEPAPHSAVSYYRSIGPFSWLHKHILNKTNALCDRIEINIPSQISWNTLAGSDIFYIERPQNENDLKAVNMAKDFGLKIWVDIDDLLHKIPKWNPGYDFYTKTTALTCFEKSLQLADVVTVSTEEIKKEYQKFNKNIHIVPNAFNNYNYEFIKKDVSSMQVTPLITWRGSATHRKDLLSISKDLFSTFATHKDWHFLMIGNETWYISDHIKNCKSIKECDIIDYNTLLKGISSSIHIVPLENIQFNRAKSNIGWMEGTFSGAAVLAPDLPEFKGNGCVNYTDNFGYMIEKLIKSKKFRKDQYEESYNYIKKNLMLSDINMKRIDIIRELLG